MSEIIERKQPQGFQWIRSKQSGRTFLCPVGSISNKEGASEEELIARCVDESENPQNN